MSLRISTTLSVSSAIREASMRLAIVRYVTKAFATRMPNARSEPMTKRRERKGERIRVSASPRSGHLRLSSEILPVRERDFGSECMGPLSILKACRSQGADPPFGLLSAQADRKKVMNRFTFREPLALALLLAL